VAAERLSVAVISPETTVFEGEADFLVAPARDGDVGILRRHAPMIVLLGSGPLRVRRDEEESQFYVSGGFMQVADDIVTVLADRAEREGP
jgi:F-type H+-transporting ATPase subunit epsilon